MAVWVGAQRAVAAEVVEGGQIAGRGVCRCGL